MALDQDRPTWKSKLKRIKPALAYCAAFLLPMLIAWPVIQALGQWETWELIAWFFFVGVGIWGWISVRDLERDRRDMRR